MKLDATAFELPGEGTGSATSTNVELVTQKLREMIVGGQLAANSRIPERDIAEALGVSRTPVRVALGILEADGLVEGHPNRGFTVCEFTADDVLSAYDVRGALEGYAVRTAIEEHNFDERRLAILAGCISECEKLLALDTPAEAKMPGWSVANQTFHQIIVHAANRRTLVKVYAQLARMPLVSPTNFLFKLNRSEDGLEGMRLAHGEHLKIFDAISKGQAGRAESLMQEHMHSVRERLADLLRTEATPGHGSQGSGR